MVAFAFTSFSSNDGSAAITGTWNLTYLGGETPIDYNYDGNANLITETGCYQGANIVFLPEGASKV
jgi:hypothetical protein